MGLLKLSDLVVGLLRFVPVVVLLLSAPVHATYLAAGADGTRHAGFVSDYERSSADPYYQFTIGTSAFEAGEYKAAARIFSDLAKTGYINAQYYLAVMLDTGAGMDADPVQSAMWYRKAAERGHVEAQYNLGIAYATGEGVPVNIRKSIYWMKKAALSGSVNSQYNLGLIYFLGNGVKANAEEGIFWWTLAAKNGDTVAQYNLGLIYLEGRGVDSDICEASRWLQISAENGSLESVAALESLRRNHAPHNCIGLVSAR